MKKIFFGIILSLNIVTSANAQNKVTNEILQSVFLIKYGNNTGTSFLVSIDSNDYLITAKHLFPNNIPFKAKIDVEIYNNKGWMKLNADLLFHRNANIDIAVLDLKTKDIKNMEFDIGCENSYLSQECFFLGFPFGLKMDDDATGRLNKGFPIPFVKKAIISLFLSDTTMKMTQIFLDGHNNPGFSGGPVVITNSGNNSKHKMRIIGVISAYLNEEKMIKTPYGDLKNNENSGIILSYAFDHVFEIIRRK